MNDIKQVIVIRKDLKMRRGKEIAQGAHASMAAIINVAKKSPDGTQLNIDLDAELDAWLCGNFKKICVVVNSEEELLSIYQLAKDNGLHCSLIQDSGLTEFGGVPTYTTCAIGPNEESKVNEITGHLKLY